MIEIDRELLHDIGFEKGTGWDVEVWVYNGWFWVYFETDKSLIDAEDTRSILITDYTRQQFFAKFLDELREVSYECLQGYRE
jgi:hypothetical protein